VRSFTACELITMASVSDDHRVQRAMTRVVRELEIAKRETLSLQRASETGEMVRKLPEWCSDNDIERDAIM